jgi:hypothetical protein
MRKHIGYVGVDSGQIMVGDPCYTLPYNRFGDVTPAERGITYDGVLHAWDGVNHKGDFIEPFDGNNTAIVVSGFGGDGVYPVFLEYETNALGTQVARIVVDFTGDYLTGEE